MNKALLESKLIIDRNDLDTALLEQCQLFYDVSTALVEATAERDATKEELERTYAKVSHEIRSAHSGEKKPTEGLIDSQIRLDEQYQMVSNQYLVTVENAAMLMALKQAYEQRSYMLKEMVQLYMVGYFGDVVPKSASAQVNDANRQAIHRKRTSG